MKKNNYFRLTLLFIISLVFIINTSCVTPMGMTASSTPLNHYKIEKNLGKSEGSDWSWSLFGLWSIGHPDLEKAINEAIKKKNGDALINVRWYEKNYYFIIFSVKKVIVKGMVVKLKPIDVEKSK